MANSAFAATAVNGGGAGKLDDIDHNSIEDGDMALVVDHANEKFYVFTYDSSSSTAESSPWTTSGVVQPDSNSGNGRWILVDSQVAKWDNMRSFLDAANLSAALTGLALKYDHIWIPATAMTPTSTNGAASETKEDWDDGTNDNMRTYLAFDGATQENACFDLVMPSAWDRGTIKAKFYWTPANGCSQGDKVDWGIQAVATGNDDDLDADQGTAVEVMDEVMADVDHDLHISGATGEVTVGGTPALSDLVHFKVYRDADDVTNDTMTEDAFLLGVVIEIAYTNEVSAW